MAPSTPERNKPLVVSKPSKIWKLKLDWSYSKDMIDQSLYDGYTHYEYPDGSRFRIQPISYPCVGAKLVWNEQTQQYCLVGVMAEGWEPAYTH